MNVTTEDRRAWLEQLATQLDYEPDQLPDLDQVVALLDYLSPNEPVSEEVAEAALEQQAALEEHGQELIDVEAVTGDPLAWARAAGIDQETAQLVHEYIGDAYDLPSATWLYYHPGGLAAVQQVIAAEQTHGLVSAEADDALRHLDRIVEAADVRQETEVETATEPTERPDPLEDLNGDNWARRYVLPEINRQMDEQLDRITANRPTDPRPEPRTEARADPELEQAIERARANVDRIRDAGEPAREAQRSMPDPMLHRDQPDRGHDLSL